MRRFANVIALAISVLLLAASCKKGSEPNVIPDIPLDTIPGDTVTVPDTMVYLTSGTYAISSATNYPDKVIGLTDATLANDAKIEQNDYLNYKNHQEWKITRTNPGDTLFYYTITNALSGKALDLPTSGTVLVQKPVENKDSQQWKLTYRKEYGAYTLINKANGLPLNLIANSKANGANVNLDPTPSSSLLWKFIPSKNYVLDTLIIHSPSMDKDITNLVITPSTYSDGRHYPVLYLLHGYGNNYNCYPFEFSQVRNLADKYGVILVCPDGNVSSWYLNAVNVNPQKWQYETYISSELISYIDTHYSTIATKEGRGILGLSMGGHGSFYNAFKHPDKYAACGSMSGALDIASIQGWDYFLGDRLGPNSGATAINWTNNSVLTLANNLTTDTAPAIMFDCGYQDGFITMNAALDNKLTQMGIAHTYSPRDGFHAGYYWNESIPPQFAFLLSHMQAAN